MINSKEIRKGNILNYAPFPDDPTTVVIIKEYDEDKVHFISEHGSHEGTCPYICLSGIPLTQKWLERFGFIRDANFSGDIADFYIHMQHQLMVTITLDSLLKSKITGEIPPMLSYKQTSGLAVQFIHKLQNRSFSLIKEELVIE